MLQVRGVKRTDGGEALQEQIRHKLGSYVKL